MKFMITFLDRGVVRRLEFRQITLAEAYRIAHAFSATLVILGGAQ